MKIASIKKLIAGELRQATLLFLLKDEEILLAMKKRGFGVGKWNGVGGKPEDGESIENTAIRETLEEICVTPTKLELVATLNFYFLEKPIDDDWNQQVLVYTTHEWHGEPAETSEMKPKWFKKSKVPYKEMWDDDKFWLPKVLAGEHVNAEFGFDKNGKVVEYSIS